MLVVKKIGLEKALIDSLIDESQTASFFQTFEWLSLWVKHFPLETLILGCYENQKLVAIAPFSLKDQAISFLGTTPVLNNQLVTDFGDLICLPTYEKEVWQEILDFLKKNCSGYKLELNFIRSNSPSFSFARQQYDSFGRAEVDTAPFLVLPKSWEEYLTNLSRHNRHELKRKLKKVEGEVSLEFNQKTEELFRLMHLSGDQKSVFLTSEMKAFFEDILETFYPRSLAGLAFLKRQDQNLATTIFFNFKNQILLYNAGFDINHKNLSPGLILAALIIKKATEDKKETIDFLRGNERYKYDLGAQDNKLYKLTEQL